MPDFATAPDGIRLAYEVVGEGPPVLLIHGFAASRIQNWKDPGWYQTLNDAGYQVIAMDCRGHGQSDKPREDKFYGHDIMAEDARVVMAATGIAPAFVMGYSMGGFISMHLLMEHPEQLRKLAIGGVGATYLNTSPQPGNRMADPETRNRIADALIEPDKNKITDPTARTFREFAEQGGKDRLALAALYARHAPQLFGRANCVSPHGPCSSSAAKTMSSPGRPIRLPPPSPMAAPSPCRAATT